MSSKTKSIENVSKAKTGEGTWKKALVAKSEWPDKDEFLDVVYWIRQVLGIILGLGWGILPFRGFLGVLLYVQHKIREHRKIIWDLIAMGAYICISGNAKNMPDNVKEAIIEHVLPLGLDSGCADYLKGMEEKGLLQVETW